jgi:cytidylate kinase
MTVFVDGEEVGGKIRTEEVGLAASSISAFPVVREKLLSLQRDAGARGGIVAEGRDMGSVVFPNADFKFFLDADLEERIRRRTRELGDGNQPAQTACVAKDMRARDQQDSQRKIAPLTAFSGRLDHRLDIFDRGRGGRQDYRTDGVRRSLASGRPKTKRRLICLAI